MRRVATGTRAGCLLVSIALLGGCPGRSAPADEPDTAAGGRATLFARLGGLDGLRALVDDLASRVASDERIQHFFGETDFRRFKAQLVVQLCSVTGGPCRYRGRSMVAAHERRGILAGHFDAFVEDVGAALVTVRAGERERDELLKLLRDMRSGILGRAASGGGGQP